MAQKSDKSDIHVGKVYLIGAGPGDPGLFTLKGKEILSKAEVVIYDRLASSRVLAFAPESAEKIYVGKRSGQHAADQAAINELIVKKAKEGKLVARLKGGDPFIFGRGGEEAQILFKAGIPFEIVPGISSAIAVPAYAGIPLTHRAYTASVALITGHRKFEHDERADIDWKNLAKGVGTLVFLMGVTNLPNITENLQKFGRSPDTPAAVIRWGTTPRHKSVTGTLKNIVQKVKEADIRPPAIIVVGEVVRLKEEINWFEKQPLLGRRIVITRTRSQASALVNSLEALGAECIELPTIDIKPPDDMEALDTAIRRSASYEWIVFSSTNAVECFCSRMFEIGLDARHLGRCGIAAVGTSTAEALMKYHLKPDLIPEDFRAEGLLKAFQKMETAIHRVLIPRAEKARELLPEGLRRLGAHVDVVAAYKTVPAMITGEQIEELEERPVDIVTFTSSSTVKNFCTVVSEGVREKIFESAKIASIGPITSKTCRDLGLRVAIEPARSTINDLVNAIKKYYSNIQDEPDMPL